MKHFVVLRGLPGAGKSTTRRACKAFNRRLTAAEQKLEQFESSPTVEWVGSTVLMLMGIGLAVVCWAILP